MKVAKRGRGWWAGKEKEARFMEMEVKYEGLKRLKKIAGQKWRGVAEGIEGSQARRRGKRKSDHVIFFNNKDKVRINNIKNSCASHMLVKKNTLFL